MQALASAISMFIATKIRLSPLHRFALAVINADAVEYRALKQNICHLSLSLMIIIEIKNQVEDGLYERLGRSSRGGAVAGAAPRRVPRPVRPLADHDLHRWESRAARGRAERPRHRGLCAKPHRTRHQRSGRYIHVHFAPIIDLRQ